MLFHSTAFVFGFLPITLAVTFALARWRGPAAAAPWLLAASLFFYAWWDPPFLMLLIGSIAFNYAVGRALCTAEAPDTSRRHLLALGIAANLLLLAECKYPVFISRAIEQSTGLSVDLGSAFLPLAISFFTFQQIAYLVAAYRREVADPGPLHYALFVSFFPQLIAGPIVLHRELLPQLGSHRLGRFDSRRLAVGLSIFVIGLFKKVILADGIAEFADPAFDAAARGVAVGATDAWGAALAYALQLYFDFSAYSDMAIGLGWMIGVRLPRNFDSPYRATSIIDFWRRWHITLSDFLRDHLYIPLGGNRRGLLRRHRNLMITMLLGGLWHGAGWTFVLWGGLHGVFLVANHLWRSLAGRLLGPQRPRPAGVLLGGALTFGCVVAAWVPFRAESLQAAGLLYRGMLGGAAGAARLEHTDWVGHTVPLMGPEAAAWLVAGLAVVWLLPNQHALFWERDTHHPLRFAPRPRWAFAIGLMALASVVGLSRASEFIYFQF